MTTTLHAYGFLAARIVLLGSAGCAPPLQAPEGALAPEATASRMPPPSFTMEGSVLGKETDDPVPTARIFLDGREMGQGAFRFGIPVGIQVILRVEVDGYLPVELGIAPKEPVAGKTLTAPIRLKRKPIVRLD